MKFCVIQDLQKSTAQSQTNILSTTWFIHNTPIVLMAKANSMYEQKRNILNVALIYNHFVYSSRMLFEAEQQRVSYGAERAGRKFSSHAFDTCPDNQQSLIFHTYLFL